MGRQTDTRRIATARERETRALELYTASLTLPQIAEQLGYRDASGAFRALRRALDRLPQKNAEEYRRAELEKYAALEARLWPGVATVTARDEAGKPTEVRVNPGVANALIRLYERRARLVGLDAAVRVHLGGDPEAEPIGLSLEGLRDEITRRIAGIAATGTNGTHPADPEPGGAPGPLLGLADVGADESTAPDGGLGDVADSGRPGMGEDADRS